MAQIFYKDDFKILFHRTDAMGNILAIPTHNWKATIYTEFGYANQGVVASSIKGVVSGAVVKENEIVFAIDNHNLQPGRIMIDWEEFIPDNDFPDGTRRVFRTYNSGSELVLSEGDSQTAIVNALLPYQYDSAYDQAVQGGYTGTKEEYYQLASQLPNAVETATKVQASADSLANSAEQIGSAIETLGATTDAIEQGANVIKDNADTLQESATIVKTSAEQIGANIADLQASVSSIDGAVEGINQGANTIANSATKVETSATTLEGVSATISGSATSLANSATAIAEGANTIKSSADTLQENADKVSESATKVEQSVEPLVQASESLNATKQAFEMLSSEWTDGRQAIATALTNRRYPTEPSESFHAMADKITNMSYEEGWFAKIGYTDDNASALKEIIDYSYELTKAWNPDGSTGSIFRGDDRLIFAPNVDVDQLGNASNMYNGCTSLLNIPIKSLPVATECSNMILGCVALRYIGDMDLPRAQFLTSFASNCSKLEYIGRITTPNCTNMNHAFVNCPKLKRIEYLDYASLASSVNIVNSSLNFYCVIANIGKSKIATFTFESITNWGVGSEENRQSLIDSLITYSYDRASNGMSTATIKLSANTKALLTEEEIAQITNKGFTIS